MRQPNMASDEAPVGIAEAASLFPSLRVRGDIAFIGISTGCPKPPLMATGTVGATQMQRLPALLQAADRQNLFRVVHLHHCPLPGVEKWRKRLTDAPQLQELLVEHGAELIVHGHGHRAHYKELITRQGMAPVIAVPSASALGLHGADPAQYNCYSVTRKDDGWHLEVLVRGYQPASGKFSAGGELSLQLQRNVAPQSAAAQSAT